MLFSVTQQLNRSVRLPWSDDQMSLRDCIDDISSADNAHQFAIMQDWDALDFMFGEERCNLAHRSLFTYGDDFVAHNIGNAQSLSVDLADNIGLCDNTDDLAFHVDDRHTADAFLRKKAHE